MDKKRYIDIDAADDKKAQYLEILNSDYLDCHPDDDLGTAYEVLYGNGISDYFDNYPFTHEQAFKIKKILDRKIDRQNVIRFIMKLRFVAEGAACLLDQPDSKTYKNDRKSMLALLEKSSDLLDAIRKDRGIYRISSYSVFLDDNLSDLSWDCQRLALSTGDLLGLLIEKLKRLDELNEQHRKKGRPTADSKGIVAEIARIWETCFGKKPTQYMEGPFAEVVQIVLQGLNLQYEYPQRKIREALKK